MLKMRVQNSCNSRIESYSGQRDRPRTADAVLSRRLAMIGAVLIEGPRACGKTATARHAASSEVLLDVDDEARRAAALDPQLVLAGEPPRLIDEWQVEPRLWNHVRRAVDDRRLPGQFILTGSSVPADDVTRHTGAGRISRLRMRPMALAESDDSTGQISLAGLLEGSPARAGDPGLDLRQMRASSVGADGPPLLRWTRQTQEWFFGTTWTMSVVSTRVVSTASNEIQSDCVD